MNADLPAYTLAAMCGWVPTAMLLMLAGPQRRAALASGIVVMPLALAAPLFGAGYWVPHRIFGGKVGVEDLSIAFQLGATTWCFASWRWRDGLRTDLRALPLVARAGLLGIAGLGCVMAARSQGVDGFTAMVLAGLAVATAAALARPGSALLACYGCIGYAPLYLAPLYGFFWLRPDFATYWSADTVWTVPVAGLPLGEIVWAILVPTAHTLAFAWAARARLA